MPDIKSIRHTTSNEDGLEEIAIERDLSIFEYLAAVIKARSFKIPKTITKVYVLHGLIEMRGTLQTVNGLWVDKKTGEVPGCEMQLELIDAKAHVGRARYSVTSRFWK